ncbi:hypothetical protein TVAG_083600 [Trichomonas vaginalis G3]|uniref:Transmembrane protein n=1 Tax=Trichomonas vaginalis (strain ATCC PRA-98 / G3) TaxID=412133 RepID=A2DM86_TRIV3|nr:hypothetical protein TVAGG3_0983720 [Trichomonas vaginalis G3]EAY18506.1 hypothetical protein TVAG_083600 [Trichomonas vaginalis G3]KAI5489505.1 hypothetical protein TVAGG3_0983720 [Trichomonas vaginalis G3]|eukprot:XP_001579492.1 hypothetical protein [Trichomonas vaginalis G3]
MENRIKAAYACFLKGNAKAAEDTMYNILDILQNDIIQNDNWQSNIQLLSVALKYLVEITEKTGSIHKSIAIAQLLSKILEFIPQVELYYKGQSDGSYSEKDLLVQKDLFINELIEIREIQYSLDYTNPQKSMQMILNAMQKQKERQQQEVYETLKESNEISSHKNKCFSSTVIIIFIYAIAIIACIIAFVLYRLNRKVHTFHYDEIRKEIDQYREHLSKVIKDL